MTPDEFRKIALSLPGSSEGAHMNHPDFRTGGRIFATIWRGSGVVMLTGEQQRHLVAENPIVFEPAKGIWGRRGSTIIKLEVADRDSVRDALSKAWRTKTKHPIGASSEAT